MNIEETIEAANIMLEWAEKGADVVWTTRGLGAWTLDAKTDPTWDWSRFEWRVKPKQPRVANLHFTNKIGWVTGIELTDEVKEALEKAGISYAS